MNRGDFVFEFFAQYGGLINLCLIFISDVFLWFRSRKNKTLENDNKELVERVSKFLDLLVNKNNEEEKK